jgi:hypothetical protein
MKKQFIVLAALIGLIAASPAHADKPIFDMPQYTGPIKCDTVVSVDKDTGLSHVVCKPEDLKKYPFLADLTKDPTEKGSIYQFYITQVQDKNLGKQIYLLKMFNETIYTIWGSAGGILVNNDGTNQEWIINGGTVTHTLTCPHQFGYIVRGNEKEDLAEWAFDGKQIKRVIGYPKLDDFPACSQ